MSDLPPPTVPPNTPPPAGGSYTPPPPPGGSYTPPPSPSGGGTGGSSDRTLMVVLSYLWILCLIPLLTKKDDAEVQWHAKNGTALLGVEVIVWVLFFIITHFLGGMIACGLSTIECVVWLGFLAIRILCIVKGTSGQRFRIPVITDFAEKM
jgi:uncharacterized membrane protein